MCIKGGKDHESGCKDGKDRKQEVADLILAAVLTHERNKDRNIEGVDRDDGQLRGIEAEEPEQRRGHQICAIEVEKPHGTNKKADDTRIDGHAAFLIQRGHGLGARTVTAHCQRIHRARAGQHQAVERAEAGNDHKDVEKRACYVPEQIAEGYLCTLGDQLVHRGYACKTDVINDIYHDDDERSTHKRDRKVALGIPQLCIDGGGNDPALIGKGGGNRSGKKSPSVRACRSRGGEGLQRVAVPKPDRRSHDCHENERNELDKGGAYLKFTADARRQHVDEAGKAEIKSCHHHGDAACGIVLTKERDRIARTHPRKHRGHAGIVNGGDKPADEIAVARPDRFLRIVDDAVDTGIATGKHGKGKNGQHHGHTAEEPCKDAKRHIAVCMHENVLRLEEHARADDDTDHHTDGRQKPVAFLKGLIVHKASRTGCFAVLSSLYHNMCDLKRG